MRPFFFALPLGALLDLLLGDPRWTLPHPVVLMGRAIAFLETIFRRLLPKTPGGELAGGIMGDLLFAFVGAGDDSPHPGLFDRELYVLSDPGRAQPVG